MINAHKQKYWAMYWQIAEAAAHQSVATRRQVGCCIVTNQGMIAVGWNGMAAGFSNQCEQADGTTDPRVIHAERNALDKLTREGISPKDSIVFVTCSPCLECAKSLYAVGVGAVFYLDQYRNRDGIDFLQDAGVHTEQLSHDH